MDLFFDNDLKLRLPKVTGKVKLDKTTPSYKYLSNKFYLRETSNHSGCWKAICLWLKDKAGEMPVVVDAMCGMGLGSKIMEKYLEPQTLICNDLSPECCDIIRENLPKAEVWNENIFDVPSLLRKRGRVSLVAVDFNTYSLKSVDWVGVLQGLAEETDWLAFADTAIYGFSRFSKNFAVYGVVDADQYYRKLARTISGFHYLQAVSSHHNAAIVLLGRRKTIRVANLKGFDLGLTVGRTVFTAG